MIAQAGRKLAVGRFLDHFGEGSQNLVFDVVNVPKSSAIPWQQKLRLMPCGQGQSTFAASQPTGPLNSSRVLITSPRIQPSTRIQADGTATAARLSTGTRLQPIASVAVCRTGTCPVSVARKDPIGSRTAPRTTR